MSPNPSAADLNNQGAAFVSQGNLSRATACFLKALEIQPQALPVMKNLGVCLLMLGDLDRARQNFLRMLDLDSSNWDAITGITDVYYRQGEYLKALQQVQPHLANPAIPPGLAAVFAQFSHHVDRTEEAITLLQTILAGTRPNRQERSSMHYAFGALLDRQGRFDEAFDSFRRANELGASFRSLRRHAGENLEGIQGYFTQATMSSLPVSDYPSKVPVFVVGMPRSGTSLVEKIIDSHPGGHGAGELNELWRIISQMPSYLESADPFPQCLNKATPANLGAIAKEHEEKLLSLANPGTTRVVDKMPGNFETLNLISILFPKAAVIHCRRHPLDTCLSCYFQNFTASNIAFSYYLEDLAGYYKRYRSLMAHWENILNIGILDVDYEKLVADPEKESHRIIEHCGLEWDPRCLEFHKEKRITRTASFDQVRQPVYKTSVARFRNYEKHLGPLKELLSYA